MATRENNTSREDDFFLGKNDLCYTGINVHRFRGILCIKETEASLVGAA